MSNGITEEFVYTTYDADWLHGKSRNVYSQFGEDGLIAATLERYGETNKTCFEFGASDGKFLSNTRHLIERDWTGLWIEGHAPSFAKMQKNKLPGADMLCEMVTPKNVNQLLGHLPRDIDLGVIDIDGDDYWVWESLSIIKPRVMVVEYSPYHEDQETLPERGPTRDSQAPLGPICRLGISKGYQLLVTTYCNSLFARKDIL